MRQFIPFAIPSGAPSTVQTQTKSATITTNGGSVTVQPDSGFLLSSATVTANIPTEAKTQSITANGTYTITPASGKLMTKATVSVAVESALPPFIAEYDYQTFSPSSNVDVNVEFSFSQLTSPPDLILISAGQAVKTGTYDYGGGVYFYKPFGMLQPNRNYFAGYFFAGKGVSNGWAVDPTTDSAGVTGVTKDGFTFIPYTYASSNIVWKAGWTYHIVAIKLKVPN